MLGDTSARADDTLLMGRCDAAKAIVPPTLRWSRLLRDALLERDELVGGEITEVIEAALQRSRASRDRRVPPSPARPAGPAPENHNLIIEDERTAFSSYLRALATPNGPRRPGGFAAWAALAAASFSLVSGPPRRQ